MKISLITILFITLFGQLCFAEVAGSPPTTNGSGMGSGGYPGAMGPYGMGVGMGGGMFPTYNSCLDSKVDIKICKQIFLSSSGILLKMGTSCGAKFDGEQALQIEKMSAFAEENGAVAVNPNTLIASVNQMRRDCDTISRINAFYLCKKDGMFNYYSAGFQKLTNRSCNEVVAGGSDVYCLKKEGNSFEVISSHAAAGNGAITCSQASIR